MTAIAVKGAKRGQDKPRRPSIAKDSVASTSTAKLLYGLAEGEVYGLVDGGKSIRLDGTPLLDDNGNANFEGVTWDFRHGTNEQDYIKGFPDVSNETGIGVELKSSQPWIKAFTDTQLSAVRVRFKWNRLSKTNPDNGDVTGYKIDYAIDLQTDGGAYQEVLKTKIEDKTSAGYERTHRIDLPKATTGWQIRVRRLTPNDPSEYVQDTMMIDAVAEVIDVKLRYPNTALLGVQYNAETFSSIAKLEAHVRGSIIRVPANYDPVARTYTGIWDGTFKDAYSNNPAWVCYDLCRQWRYGLGERLDATMIDKWSLYTLGQYCDEMVSDGQGGLEPRFTCNVYLQKQADAYQVLQNIAGIFRGMSYWNGEKIFADADVPQDPVYTFSRANVIDGQFEYTGTRARDRHTLAKVAWDNPLNSYQTEYEYVRDEKAMAKLGVKVLELNAFGCTSQAQAQRAGLWALKTEQLETRQVSFGAGLDAVKNIKVGKIINVSDELFAGRANGGRVSTVNDTQRIIELDREVVAAAGDVLIINSGNGKSERRNISYVNGNRITVTAGFTGAEPEHVWAIETADLKLMRFRVMSITQNDDVTFNVTAIQHETQKFPAVDFGTDVKPTDITIVNPETVDAPASVTITSRHRVVQGQTITTLIIAWAQVKDAVAYDVEWRKDDGSWIKVPRTGNVSVEIEGVYSGNYTARVRSVSAFDVQSQPTTSTLTAIEGKAGLPPKIVGLTATGVLFGMDLKWGFQAGSGDADYTEIQVGSAPNVNVATLGQYSYPTNTHTINGLQGNLAQSYRARLVDKLGFKSEWSAWVTGTTDANADKVMDLIQGQIDESSLNDILTSKIADIEINKDAISQETQDRIQAIIDVNTRIADEAEDRVEALRQQSLRQDGLQEMADGLAEDINTITLSQIETDEGLASIKERQETFEIEQGVQAESLNYLSSELDFGFTDATKFTSKNRGTAWTFAKTVAHEDYTNAQMIRGLSADYEDSSARFTENIELLASKNESLATRTSNLSAQLVGGYDGNDLTKLSSGLLFEESKARAGDVEGLAEQISLLSAGVGEQFDSFEIWHFDKDADGWTGGTYSKGFINARTTPLSSPTIADLDGSVYRHVKLRVKKVGTPTWEGLLSYAGGTLIAAEPEYDTDGIGIANWHTDWTGDITSISLKMASAADNLNYYAIDWIAIGRPSPGASNAALLRESSVRAAETSANASDLLALNSQINGGNGVPIESSITKKLDTTADVASTTADEVSALKSTYDEDMYGYEGTVQTTARTLAGETQAVAESLDLLSSEVKHEYTDKTKYTDKNRSMQWTFAKSVAADNYAANERIINLQSEFANSNANFTNELFTLAEKDKSIAADITQLYAETDDNYGLIQDVNIAISDPKTGLAAKVTELQSSVNNPNNLASLIDGAAAFSDEFGSISGKFANFEAVIDGQKTAMEVISGVGNAEKLKNEIAKARLDKDVTNLNAQSLALTNQINSYTTKISELINKRDAPKPPYMSQSEYTALRAEYQKQIDDITAAKDDLTAQKAVIADQVAQLAAEKKVLDDFKEVEDGVRAQHTIKTDNAGKIVGFGLVLQKDGFSAFDVRADRFSISAPSDKPNDVNGTSPFMVLTNPQVIDGVTVPAGTYMRDFYAPRGSIDTLQVADGAITTAKIGNAQVDTAQIANGAIETAKIGNAQVDTLQIKGEAVIVPRVQFTAAVFKFYTIDTEEVINSITMDADGGGVSISFGFERLYARAGGNDTGYQGKVYVRLKRDNIVLRTLTYSAETLLNPGHALAQYYLLIEHRTLPTILDNPPAGSHTYTVTLESRGLNAGKSSTDQALYPVEITARSLHIMGAKR